jgi:PhnB protein
MMTRGIPEGYHTATPYLIVHDAAGAIAFYKQAFGAMELNRTADATGNIINIELKIGSSPIMVSQHSNIASGGKSSLENLPPVSIYLYVEDAETLAKQAIAAGATELYPVQAQPYGNLEGGILDPFGITWWIATQMEKAVSDQGAKS